MTSDKRVINKKANRMSSKIHRKGEKRLETNLKKKLHVVLYFRRRNTLACLMTFC